MRSDIYMQQQRTVAPGNRFRAKRIGIRQSIGSTTDVQYSGVSI